MPDDAGLRRRQVRHVLSLRPVAQHHATPSMGRVTAEATVLEADWLGTCRRAVSGLRGVLSDHPTSREPRRNLRPRVATRSKWARIEALLRNRAFVEDYTHARERWRDGAPIAFPPGTSWLRRFAYVSVAET